jgi:hypothetical protein
MRPQGDVRNPFTGYFPRKGGLMNRLGRSGLSLIILAMASGPAVPLDAQALAGRSRIELRVGLGMRSHAGTSASTDGTVTDARAEGLLGALGYSRWLSERAAVVVSVGLLAADAETRTSASGAVDRAAAVVPILVGVRYYFPESTFGSAWRPFASVEAGPVIGFESRSEAGLVVANEAVTRGAYDARLGAGVDVQLSRLLMLGLVGGYNFMTDFADPIAGERNHSGPDAGVSISLVLGGGRTS